MSVVKKETMVNEDEPGGNLDECGWGARAGILIEMIENVAKQEERGQ